MKKPAAVAAVACACFVSALPAGAHNAGHFLLPDGTCHEVGSLREAPLVGPDGTPLDLIPATPQDEYGTSFAAFRGATPILPGPCPR